MVTLEPFQEISKMLLSFGTEVESFIQGCSKDAWIQSAIEQGNMSEHISSLGFNLQLFTTVLSTRKKFATLPSLTVAQVANMREDEARIVKKIAALDEMRLIEDVNDMIQSSKLGSDRLKLATFLLERLRSQSEHPRPASDRSDPHPGSLFENLEELKILGKGAFGTVHKARWLGVEVAKKVVHREGMSHLFREEVAILHKLCHPNIVSLLGCTMTDVRKSYMIMELMDGDLHSLMEERMEQGGVSPFTIPGTLDIILQVAEGMLFLHENRIVHRDLKSHNILYKCVKTGHVNVMCLHVKLADFGLSKTKEKSVTYSDQTWNQGTPRWMAPELIKIRNDNGEMFEGVEDLKYPFKSDVYSFAMVCCEILTGCVPFSTLISPSEVKKKVLDGNRPQLPDTFPNKLKKLIEECWSSKPSARPGFDHICAELRHMKYSYLLTSAWSKVPRCFSFKDIVGMTNNFNNENLLSSWSGSSTFKTTTYKGVVVDTGENVAVQRVLDAGNTSMGFDLSKMDMEVLPRLHHHNSVRFIGFSCERNERILVFEDMANSMMLHEYETDSNRKGERNYKNLSILVTCRAPALVWEASIEAYLTHYLDLNFLDLLAFPLQVVKLWRKSMEEVDPSRQECLDLNNRVEELTELLQKLLARASKLTNNAGGLYVERPTRRIMLEVVKVLENAVRLVRMHKRNALKLMKVETSNFCKVNSRLTSSIGDATWLLNISSWGTERLTEFNELPPIASTDPVLGQVWKQVSIVNVGTAEEKAVGAENLGNLAKDNERNVKVIIEEGGVAPLLRLLKEGTTSYQQEAAATVIELLARDKERVRQLRDEGARNVITHILGSHSTSMTKVKLQVARVTAKFVSLDEDARRELRSEGAIRLLVSLLMDQTKSEVKEPELDELKVEAAHLLWKIAAGNVNTCKLITDTCELQCFANLMEHSRGELKYYSVMIVMEIAAAAKSDSEFGYSTFTTNSHSAKAVVEMLLAEIKSEKGEPRLQVPCCKAIGSLARSLPAPAELAIRALTSALANQDQNVAKEAASALSKFVSDENYLHLVHSMNIIAEGAVGHLVLLALNFGHSESQLSALGLLCYLSLNVPDSEALARGNVVQVFKSIIHAKQLSQFFAKNKTARLLITDAITRLEGCQFCSNKQQGFPAHRLSLKASSSKNIV
ncbi:hypothetical protein M758_11G047300 [Ceratodon purpureus]|nr:hypothetical protein M758_11G047300 [Ceratodon purpureus]